MGSTAQAREEKVGRETDGQRRRAGRGYLDEIIQEEEGSQEIAGAHSATARMGPGQRGWMTMMGGREERTAHARQDQADKARPDRLRMGRPTRRDETRQPARGTALFWGWGGVGEGEREIVIVSAHTCQAQAGSAGRGRQRCNAAGLRSLARGGASRPGGPAGDGTDAAGERDRDGGAVVVARQRRDGRV
jgi:hypothetical protein